MVCVDLGAANEPNEDSRAPILRDMSVSEPEEKAKGASPVVGRCHRRRAEDNERRFRESRGRRSSRASLHYLPLKYPSARSPLISSLRFSSRSVSTALLAMVVKLCVTFA
jgi:hypothetical protein